MSWGTKIAVLYIGFVAMIVLLIARTTRENVDLVTEDYYQQELQYQDRIDQRTAATASGMQPEVTITGSHIEITFPGNTAGKSCTGTIQFYRPSDAAKDFTVPVATDSNRVQLVDLSLLEQGLYQLKFAWTSDQQYYSETQLYVP
jgi:hypothetical protein